MTERPSTIIVSAPEGMPEDVYHASYSAADDLCDLFGCDSEKRGALMWAFADAITAERERAAKIAAAPVVIADWMRSLSLQQQSVVMLATRGPDGVRKHHPAKKVHCAYRATVLRAAYRDRFLEWGENADGFMSLDVIASESAWDLAVRDFFGHVDELPHHYVAHLAHAAQIIGHRHPDERFRRAWLRFYLRWCEDLHVNPETHAEMNQRLGDWGAAAPRLGALGIDFELPGEDDQF